MKISVAAVATGLLLAASFGTAHATYTLNVTNGGDGHTGAPDAGFDHLIVGSNNGVIGDTFESLTTLTDTFATAETFTFHWQYTTFDCCGAGFDPGGYILNGVEFQLTPGSSSPGATFGGWFTITLNPGDNFGFYVDSLDSLAGPATMEFANTPEPATWAMMLAGFTGLGALLRGRRRLAAA
jgi:hypothetical protein